MVTLDLWQGIMNGFATGIGAGVANYFIIRRFEKVEKKIQEKLDLMSGKSRKISKKKVYISI